MLWCCCIAFDIVQQAYVQSKAVTGTVKDGTGIGMPGVIRTLRL
jgi:hypothetical protein